MIDGEQGLTPQPIDPDLAHYVPSIYHIHGPLPPEIACQQFVPQTDALRYAEYYRQVATRAKNILAKVLPEIYVETGCKCTFDPRIRPDYQDGAARVEAIDIFEDSGIIFYSQTPLTPGNEWQERVPAFPSSPDLIMARGVRDVLKYVHEYAHELFGHYVIKPDESEVKTAKSKKYVFPNGRFDHKAKFPNDLDMVERALNEGFAIQVETMAGNELLTHADEYDFSEDITKDVEVFQAGRKASLIRNERNLTSTDPNQVEMGKKAICYNEGYSIIQALFLDRGIDGLRELNHKLDPVIISITERSSPEYQQVLQTPLKIFEIFGKK